MTLSPLNGSSEFLRHESCPECGSSDGLAVYDDGHTFCFVCHTWTPGNSSTTKLQLNTRMYQGSAIRLNKRGISEKTCERFKIYKDGNTLRFHYHDSEWSSSSVPRQGRPTSNSPMREIATGTFFGQHLWKGYWKTHHITEGELDCASYAEIAPTWDVVSLPTGAAGAKKAIQKNYDFLQGYEEITLWFDNDEPGCEAAKAAADILPPGKVRIARLESLQGPLRRFTGG